MCYKNTSQKYYFYLIYGKKSVSLLPNSDIMQRFKIFFLLLCCFCCAKAQSVMVSDHAPKHEVRAVWLTTIGGIDWPHSYSQSSLSAEKQQQELRSILDSLKRAKINTVLLQTRIRGTVIYPSQYEPWDGCLSGFPGRTPGYDALRFAIDECHKRGMELHAWVVTIPVGKWNAPGCKTLRKRMPGLIKKIGADGYMNPEDSRTGTYLANICREITRGYDVDGIHLDYIRYPETWNLKVSRDRGRGYITSIVEKIHDAVKAEKPWVKMSCAPIGKRDDLSRYWSHGWNAYTKVCQDAEGWLRDGLMDELFPMMYFRNEQFFPFAIDWKEQSHGKIIAPGLGIYFLDPKEGKWSIGDITREMHHLRNIGLGYAFFRNKFFLDNQQGIYDFTADFNPYPALVPPMTWLSSKRPKAPAQMDTRKADGTLRLTWDNPSQYEDGSRIPTPYIYNNVYASRTYPVDVTDAHNLILARSTRASITLRADDDDAPLYFAVTAMDGFGNESQPTQNTPPPAPATSEPAKTEKTGAARMLVCDGKSVILPPTGKNVSTKRIIIETLRGTTVDIRKPKGNKLNISDLPNGAYSLKSLEKKGITHMLGTFIKKKNEKVEKKLPKNLVE